MKRAILLLSAVCFISCTTAHIETTTNGFDAACTIFSDAESLNLSPEELGSYLGTRLEEMPNLPEKDSVNQIYHALFNVSPEKRYDLFKESAEIALQQNWDCVAMKRVYQAD